MAVRVAVGIDSEPEGRPLLDLGQGLDVISLGLFSDYSESVLILACGVFCLWQCRFTKNAFTAAIANVSNLNNH